MIQPLVEIAELQIVDVARYAHLQAGLGRCPISPWRGVGCQGELYHPNRLHGLRPATVPVNMPVTLLAQVVPYVLDRVGLGINLDDLLANDLIRVDPVPATPQLPRIPYVLRRIRRWECFP